MAGSLESIDRLGRGSDGDVDYVAHMLFTDDTVPWEWWAVQNDAE